MIQVQFNFEGLSQQHTYHSSSARKREQTLTKYVDPNNRKFFRYRIEKDADVPRDEHGHKTKPIVCQPAGTEAEGRRIVVKKINGMLGRPPNFYFKLTPLGAR